MIFVTGGVRSGKSSYAERRAIALQKESGTHLHYVATSRTYDREMENRVQRHKLERERSGAPWIVHEQKTAINELFPLFKKGDVVLVDCITTLVSNEFFRFSKSNEPLWQEENFQKRVEQKLGNMLNELKRVPCEPVLVSNEVFSDIATDDKDTEEYKRLLGRIHQHIVSLSDEAIQIEYGIPCWKKGEKR